MKTVYTVTEDSLDRTPARRVATFTSKGAAQTVHDGLEGYGCGVIETLIFESAEEYQEWKRNRK